MKAEEQRAAYTAARSTVSAEWPVVPFEKVATPQSDRGKRTKQRDYLPEGRIPVIDQGQAPIGGYTDDEDFAFSGELPVVLFGDHTRAVKLVSHRFAVGADGIKIFRPAEGVRPKYLYYWMKSARIPDRGYGRHYQYLRQLSVPLPPPAKQDEIVAEIEKQFSRLDEAVANLKRVKANLKRYKAAALKAAVEGKLTEAWRKQHPDTEPASELLQRILAERRAKWEQAEFAKMQAKGKAPKDDAWKKKYSESAAPDATGQPELPEGWVWAKTDQLFWFVTSGSRGWAEYYSDEGAQFLRIGNLDHDSISIDFSDLQRVNPPNGAEGTRTRVEPGDILVSITADVGMIAVAPRDLEESYINQHISLARPVSSLNGDFLAWFLCSKDGQDQFKELQRGATKAGLGLDDIRAVNVPLPPLAEQSAIVFELDRCLSLADEADAQVNANLQRAVRLRQSILSVAFNQR